MLESIRGFYHDLNFKSTWSEVEINRESLPILKGDAQFPMSPRTDDDLE